LNDHFVVITRAAAGGYRAWRDDPAMPLHDVRRVMIAVLGEATSVASYDGPTGPVREFAGAIFDAACRLRIVYPVEPDGRPRLAPDGKCRMAILTHFTAGDNRLRHRHLRICRT
jgi:hypothetical protein